jgi:hypothetical protein
MEGSTLRKVTVFVDAADYDAIAREARSRREPVAARLRAIMASHVRSRGGRRAWPRSVGMGRSRTGDLSLHVDELLADGFGRS